MEVGIEQVSNDYTWFSFAIYAHVEVTMFCSMMSMRICFVDFKSWVNLVNMVIDGHHHHSTDHHTIAVRY